MPVCFLPPLEEIDIQEELIRLGADKESASISAGVAEGSLQIAKMQLLQKEELKEIEVSLIDCLRMSFRAAGNPAIGIELMQWANTMSQMGRPKQKVFLRFGLNFIRQAVLTSYQTKALVRFQSLTQFDLERFAPYMHSQNISEITLLFEKALYAIERNGNGKIIFSDFCLQLTRLLNTKEG